VKVLQHIQHLAEPVKSTADHLAFTGILLTLAQWLPSIAALMSIAWYAYRFYDAWQKKRQGKQLDPNE
jgi:hypothetical protein